MKAIIIGATGAVGYDLLEQLRTGLDYEYISPMDDNRMFGIYISSLISEAVGASDQPI